MKTQELLYDFCQKNGNPDTDLTINENDTTIELILEGVASESFDKPNDFVEYIQGLS